MSYKNPGCFIATRVCRSAERRHGEPGFPMTETRALRVRPYSPSASSVPPKKSPVPSDGFQRNRRPQPFYKSDAAVSCGKGFEPPCCRFTSRQLRLRYGHKPIYGRGLSSFGICGLGAERLSDRLEQHRVSPLPDKLDTGEPSRSQSLDFMLPCQRRIIMKKSAVRQPLFPF